MNENELLNKLQSAIQNKIEICDLHSFVGYPSTINTCLEKNKDILKHIDYGPDPDYPDQFKRFTESEFVVYWVIEHSRLAKIIGLCINHDNKPSIFRAIIYPP